MATCSFKGCRKICQGTLCRRHYNAKRARKQCSVEGCTGPAVTHGICEHHRGQERTEARQLARAKAKKNEVRRQKRAVKKEMTIREQERPMREDFYSRTYAHRPDVESESKREIDYRDETPKAFKVQIPLWEYFERVKRFKITRWQKHLADALQEAAEQRHVKRWLGLIHCEGQGGKTTLISHCFPAWCIGHNPLFRFALAMYNQSRSQQHSLQVIEIMQSKLHKDIFPNEAGWIRATAAFGRAETVAKSGWYTQARWDAGDMQFSFNPVGLLSGLTGSSADWLGLDDPYRDAKDAFSQLINQGMHNFWEYTVVSRLSEHTCVSGMFHRYAPDDFAGYLLDKGNFEYLRYASQCDGDYIHPNTGQKFPDPIGRKEGEYLMPERRPSSYYNEAKKNKRVWLSMYQGRPSDEEGEMFSVGKIHIIDGDELQLMKDQVSVWGRGYDIASTEEAGAYTVGWHAGMLPDGRILFDDMYRKRVDTAARQAAMKSNAEKDGADCLISIPIDPGAAGKSVVAYTEADMEGFTIVARTTTDNKVQRALNFSIACNSGKVYFAKTTRPAPEFDKNGVEISADWVDWNHQAKKELREFPLSDYKDITDAGADIYNTLFEATRRGLVVKNYKPQRNLVTIEQFRAKFQLKELKIPEKWTIYAGVKLSQEASRASSAVIVARASAHAALPESLFVLDEYKAYDANMYALFDWLTARTKTLCDGRDITVWLHPDSEQHYQTIASKLDVRVTNFPDDQLAGLNELNWYLLPTEEAHPFGNLEHAAHLYFLTSSDQFSDAIKDKEHGFYHCRQEMATWGFTDKGDPTKVGDVADCLRMITHRFKTYEEAFTFEEELDIAIKKHMPPEGPMTHARQQQLTWARHLARAEMMEKHGEDVFDDYNPSGYEETFQ